MEANKSFIFGPFRLDLANERLSRENDDIRLTPKAFAVLKYLVERSDRLVTKDDLLENVWADAYVTEAALTVCITEIRKALGDDAKEPKFIETVHRRGYRFIEPVKIDDQLTSQNDSHVSSGVSPSGEADAAIRTPERDTAIDSKPPLEREKELTHSDNVVRRAFPVKAAVASIWAKAAMAIAAVLLVGVGALFGWNVYRQAAFAPETVSSKEGSPWSDPEKPSIAVLAFDNVTGDPNQEYLSDGISDDIITRLARIPALVVIARNSSFTYKDKPVKVQEVGRELSVRYVLEGSVRRTGERIRINSQLIEASTGKHL